MQDQKQLLLRAHELIKTTKEYLDGYAIHEHDTDKPFTEVTATLQDWLYDYEDQDGWLDGLLINLSYWLPVITLGCILGSVYAILA